MLVVNSFFVIYLHVNDPNKNYNNKKFDFLNKKLRCENRASFVEDIVRNNAFKVILKK